MKNTIGQRLKFVRLENNMTITELAKAASMPESELKSIENDSIIPDINTLARLALILNVSVNKLVSGINDPE